METLRREIIEEAFKPNAQGTGGKIITDDHEEIEVTWNQVNSEKGFRKILDRRGDFARFAYDHNVGLYFPTKEARAYWLGAESHYDEDDFFYVTDVPGYEGKKVAFQLRVSNHPNIDSDWERVHSMGNFPTYGGKPVSRPEVKCDFCLNLIFNEDDRNSRIKDRNQQDLVASQFRVTTIDVICNYYRMTGEERREIDNFVNAVTSGQQPTISYKDIFRLFVGSYETRRKSGKPVLHLRYSGPGDAREHNFLKRENLPFDRGYYGWNGERTIEDVTAIPLNFITDNGIQNGEAFEYKGKNFRFNEDNLVAYPIKVMRRSHEQYDDVEHPVEIVAESIIRITRNELMEMIVRVIKEIL